jgi:hypothetical protein
MDTITRNVDQLRDSLEQNNQNVIHAVTRETSNHLDNFRSQSLQQAVQSSLESSGIIAAIQSLAAKLDRNQTSLAAIQTTTIEDSEFTNNCNRSSNSHNLEIPKNLLHAWII